MAAPPHPPEETLAEAPGEGLAGRPRRAGAPARHGLDLGLGQDRYADAGAIGQGGMSSVRRVWDGRFGVHVAMKLLRLDLVDDPLAQARFASEARITARLQHPGVVAVYDEGRTPAGQPWFTMTEVQGQTFGALIAGAHAEGAPSPEQRRRLLGLLLRAAETVAYAHEHGILHRDLKPSNLMVGAFDEVRVMDWGLARALDHAEDPSAPVLLGGELRAGDAAGTQQGAVLGTPAYMPPEQARGALEAMGPTADVYALGAVLHELLAGVAPLTGSARAAWSRLLQGPVPLLQSAAAQDAPEELRALCCRALAWRPEDRFPDAGHLARALRDWLDGARRRARAQAILADAARLRPEAEALRRRAREQRGAAAALLAPLLPHSPVSRKAPAWALEDAAAEAEAEAALAELRWERVVASALQLDPELPEAHEVLAEHYAGRLQAAEAEGDGAEVARAELLLAEHDRGRHAALLHGAGVLTLVSEPPGAEVRLFALVERERRVVAEPRGLLGRTPLVEQPLDRGSWLLELHAPGREPVRYPVHLQRGESWTGSPPGSTEPQPVVLPLAGSLPEGAVYVPGGWFLAGGDPLAIDALPRQRVWLDPFCIGRTSVTMGTVRRLLQARLDRGEDVGPLLPYGDTARSAPLLRVEEGTGQIVAHPDQNGLRWADDWPAAGLDWHAARVLAAELGGALPHELEWAKAARGVDGRVLPWGRTMEPTWAAVLGRSGDPPCPAPAAAFEVDQSPYGARDLAGGVRDWCDNAWTRGGPALAEGRLQLPAETPTEPEYRSARGGAWASTLRLSRLATRFANRPDQHFNMLGFRVVWRGLPGT